MIEEYWALSLHLEKSEKKKIDLQKLAILLQEMLSGIWEGIWVTGRRFPLTISFVSGGIMMPPC